MANKQNLNSLERFVKKPAHLVLEEHGHCEVPAGCGGVVLRWRNPFAALPVTIHLYSPWDFTWLLDGNEPRSARIDLTPGTHALGVMLKNADLSAGLILFAATHDPKEHQRLQPGEVAEKPLRVVTAEDGTWKCLLTSPASTEWTTPTFDDREWIPLKKLPTPKLTYQDKGGYQCMKGADAGAAFLGLGKPSEANQTASWWRAWLSFRPPQPPAPGVRGDVWIRKVFVIPAPEGKGSPA